MKRRGMTLLEVLMAICCFLFAIVPIIQMFSFSIDNVKTFHVKSLTTTAAQEILSQSCLLSPAQKTDGSYVFGPGGGETAVGPEDDPFLLLLSPVPGSLENRVLEMVTTGDGAGCDIRVGVQARDQARASLDWTWHGREIRGGR